VAFRPASAPSSSGDGGAGSALISATALLTEESLDEASRPDGFGGVDQLEVPSRGLASMTLPRFVALLVGLLAGLAALVLSLAVRTSSQAIIRFGESARVARARQVAASVEADLDVAEQAVGDFETALSAQLVDARDAASVRRVLAGEVIARRGLADLTLTSGTLEHYAEDGAAMLAAVGRRQVSVFRSGSGSIDSQLIEGAAAGGPRDPTLHDTFRAAANRDQRGRALWSDLAFSQLDAGLPAIARRKTMTVQKAIFVASGASQRFVGVLRAGIVSDTLDRIGGAVSPDNPHRVFICDASGRLITRLSPQDNYQLVDPDGHPDPDGDLRVVPAAPPAPVVAALEFARESGAGGKRMVVAGEPYLLTLLPVAEGRAQEWLVGVVVPESAYVGSLTHARDRLLVLLAVALLAIALIGTTAARTVGRGVSALVSSTEAMRRFSFEPAASVASPFREIRAALGSVERAKTALRAMVKYVPIDLVRRLYESGRDPVLGADVTEISIMFTDIADFTAHAEALTPRALAEALGGYLEIATRAVEATGGTVDKYIGDALMVLWNAPSPLADHPAAACRAALTCAAATRALGDSPAWRELGLAPWRTRFGLHVDRVLVGNFGAPARLTYTAMGDGVNLAARLEGLNKLYGTTILVSDDVRARAGGEFAFRKLDRVAVKGKSRAVVIHELLGLAGDPALAEARGSIDRYEKALDATFARRFADAIELLAAVGDDRPSAVLAERCRVWLVAPPASDWDGTWTATSK
jgi:adenylate cyclase